MSGLTTSFYSLLLSRVMVGLALETLFPVAAAVTSDIFRRDQRGTAFSIQAIAVVLGVMIGSMIMGSFASTEAMGFTGWQLVLLCTGIFGIIVSVLCFIFIYEPMKGKKELDEAYEQTSQNFEVEFDPDEIIEPVTLFTILLNINKTYILLIFASTCQAIAGNGFSFLILWYLYAGFSDFTSSMFFSWACLMFLVGGVCGGVVADYGTKRPSHFFHNHFRLFVGQFGTFSSILSILFLIFVVGQNPTFASGFIGSSMLGFFSSICPQSTDNPLITEVIHPKVRAAMIGYASVIGSMVGSTGSVLVGRLAEEFGYVELPEGMSIAELSEEERAINRIALGKSLVWVSAVCWGCQFFFYTVLYGFYPRQRDALHTTLRVELGEESVGDGGELSLKDMSEELKEEI
jgi:MFS family permease